MKWDRYVLRTARNQAVESKDPSTKVGACILRPDGTIASCGWNGFARKVFDLPDRLEDRETKLAITLHAELNAILSAREPLHGYTLYVTPLQPCAHCASVIIQAGINRVVAPVGDAPQRWHDNMKLAQRLFHEAGVEMHFFTGPC